MTKKIKMENLPQKEKKKKSNSEVKGDQWYKGQARRKGFCRVLLF